MVEAPRRRFETARANIDRCAFGRGKTCRHRSNPKRRVALQGDLLLGVLLQGTNGALLEFRGLSIGFTTGIRTRLLYPLRNIGWEISPPAADSAAEALPEAANMAAPPTAIDPAVKNCLHVDDLLSAFVPFSILSS